MTDSVLVRPRRGLILDGIPRKGAEIPRPLAEQWIADQLVELVPEIEQPSPVIKTGRPLKQAPSARKRRRTSGK